MVEPAIPEALTQADNPLFKVVGEAVQELGAGSDLANLFAMLEKGEALFARFVPMLERAGQTILKMRQLEADGGVVAADGVGAPLEYVGRAELASSAPPGRCRMGHVVIASDNPPAPAAPGAGITPIQAYSKLLGLLGHLPGDLTIDKALAQARNNKPMLLQVIAGELASMEAGGDDDDRPRE